MKNLTDTINDNTRLKRRSDILTADMDGSAVTMDMQTGKYYNFGETGGWIWNHLDKEKTLNELLNEIASEFGIDKEMCREDTLAFVEKLKKDGLLEKCE